GGWPVLKGLEGAVKARNPGMMTLIGFAITVAYVYSVATELGLMGMDFCWELATLILTMLLGQRIEMKSVTGASRGLELSVQIMPPVRLRSFRFQLVWRRSSCRALPANLVRLRV